jgi:N-acetylglucosaminyl-diphospho-decaprenol L-rhamnosyltransferase
MIDLSIVIVTYNSAVHIGACLESLGPSLDGVDAEVIVVDNASSDGTAAIVRKTFPHVRVIETGANLGFAGGINAGLASAAGKYAAWINPDTAIVGGRFADVLAWMDAHPRVGIAGLKLLADDGSIEPSHRGFPGFHSAVGHRYSLLTRVWPGNPWSRRYLRTGGDADDVTEADWVSGAALVHRRDVSRALGGLDPEFFMYCEDVDFCFRAVKAGHQVRYLPLVTVRHEIGGSSSGAKRAMIRARHESLWRYYKKHLARNPVKDALAYVGIFTRCRWLLLYDMLGGRRVK